MDSITNENLYLADGIIPDTNCDLQNGQIALANTAMFDERHLSVPLTQYVVGGWDRDPLMTVLEFYAPATRPVPRNFTHMEFTNEEEFVSDDNDEDIRTIRGDFKEVQYKGTTASAQTHNKGLRSIVDVDYIGQGITLGQELRNRADKLRRRLLRNEIRRAVTALSAAANNSNKTWDTSAGKNPDQDVKTQLITAADASGLRPNRVGYGMTAWNLRGLSYGAQNNAAGYAHAGMTPAQVAGNLMVDQVLTDDARYQNTSSAKEQIVKNLVLMFFADSGLDQEDPSNIKRFISSTRTGQQVAVYTRQLSEKLYQVVVEHYSLIKVTYATGIEKFTVS